MNQRPEILPRNTLNKRKTTLPPHFLVKYFTQERGVLLELQRVTHFMAVKWRETFHVYFRPMRGSFLQTARGEAKKTWFRTKEDVSIRRDHAWGLLNQSETAPATRETTLTVTIIGMRTRTKNGARTSSM
jgi:hypothetical protein